MIDLRSDTVTRPSKAMRSQMMFAEVGDDVYGDDPTVNRVQDKVAALLGKEAALLVASGTQSNLVGLLTHCGRGDEYIVGQDYHSYIYESGGAASLGGIVPQPIAVASNGTLDLVQVAEKIKPDDVHFAKTRLLALENTHSGKVISNEYLERAISLAHQNGMLAHLDGARVFNAAVAQNIEVKQITRLFDSLSICCSKGLGAPIGSLLAGTEAFINRAKRWRKMVGGGMRQAGIIASAIEYALDHNIERLDDDHKNALKLEDLLAEISDVEVESANTNMLYLEFETEKIANHLAEFLKTRSILIPSGKRVRLVTHLDIDGGDIERFVRELKNGLDDLPSNFRTVCRSDLATP